MDQTPEAYAAALLRLEKTVREKAEQYEEIAAKTFEEELDGRHVAWWKKARARRAVKEAAYYRSVLRRVDQARALRRDQDSSQ